MQYSLRNYTVCFSECHSIWQSGIVSIDVEITNTHICVKYKGRLKESNSTWTNQSMFDRQVSNSRNHPSVNTSFQNGHSRRICRTYSETQYLQLVLTQWDRVTYTCVRNIVIIASNNSLSPGRCQAIIWTNAKILLIGRSWINFNGILIEINTSSFTKIHLRISPAK